jgi:uncharacterized membrane protein YhhN
MLALGPVLYVGVALAVTAAEAIGPEWAAPLKPLMMPALAAAVAGAVRGSPRSSLDAPLAVALAGGWVGDIALVFAPAAGLPGTLGGVPRHPAFFFVGVAGFFVGHLGYLRALRAGLGPRGPGRGLPPALGAALGALAVVVLAVIVARLAGDPARAPAIGPVLVYAALLVAMALAALDRRGRAAPASVGPAIAGALCFLLSDALIGLRFIAGLPVPGAGPAILASDTAAQGLRAVGLVRQRGAAASPG